MIVRMVHPEHGAMHVYDNGELERNRKFGWVPESEVVPVINGDTPREPEDVIAPEAGAMPVVNEPPKRKPGRPRKGE